MLTVRSIERIHESIIVRIPVEFTREKNMSLTVRQVDPGAVRIADEIITENVIIFRDEIQRGISLGDIASLREEDLDELLAKQPEIVIFGTGWQAGLPHRELVFAMARRGIGFETMDTPAACRTFNILISEGRDVAAILIIRE